MVVFGDRNAEVLCNFVVVYACLLCDLENHVKEFVAPHFDDHMLYFKRYINDAFGIWTGPEEFLKEYLANYSFECEETNITTCISKEEVDMLDVHFFKGPDFEKTHRLSTSTHPKIQNKH